jgi:MFS family permease
MGLVRRLADNLTPLRHRNYRLVWLAELVSDIGDWAARLAVTILVLERTDSAALSTFGFAVAILPALLLGPYLSAFGDRYPRRAFLVVADLVRMALYGAMALPVPTWALFPLLFVASTASPPFEAVRGALLPSLVPADTYPRAVMLSSVSSQGALLGGYAVGGVVVAAVGTRAALAINAGTFLVSALVLSRVDGGTHAPSTATPRESLQGGWACIVGDAVVRRAFALLLVVDFVTIGAEVLAPAYADEVLHAGPRTAGLLAAAVPLGTIAMAALRRHDLTGRDPVRPIALGAALSAFPAAILFGFDVGSPVVVLAFAAVGGVFGSLLLANALFGARIPDEVRAASFGVLSAGVDGSQALGAVAAGLVAEVIGVRTTCGVGLALAGALATTFLVARTGQEAEGRDAVLGPEEAIDP